MRERRKQRAAGVELPLFGALSLVENDKRDAADEIRPTSPAMDRGDSLTDLPIAATPLAGGSLSVEDLVLPDRDELPDLPLQRDPNAPLPAESRLAAPPVAEAPPIEHAPRQAVGVRTPAAAPKVAPYARPVDRARKLMEGVLEPEDEPQLREVAGWGERLQAGIVDGGLFASLLVAVAFLTHRMVPLQAAMEPRVVSFLGFAVLLAAFYAGYFTGTTGQTPGKMVQRLRVVDDAGEAPGFLRACGRGLLGLAGVALAGLGIVPGIFDSAHRALHDRVFRTRVVRI